LYKLQHNIADMSALLLNVTMFVKVKYNTKMQTEIIL